MAESHKRRSKNNNKFDEIDRHIIALLRQEGRRSNIDIAKQLGVTETTIRKRIKRLITEDVMRVVAITNPYKIGYQIDTLIGIHVEPDKVMAVSRQLAHMEEVRYVGVTTGTYDLMIAALFRSNEELLQFVTAKLGTTPGVRSTQTSHVLKVLKRTFDWVMREDQ